MFQIHNDDISSVLILNKKSIPDHEQQLFQSELDKFRPHQNRLLQATHKQNALMKDLTKTYSSLLQDKRVKSEQVKYESFTRQRNTVLSKYKKVYEAFNDLIDGLVRAQNFYSEMKETVESQEKNVEGFVNNRRSEGAQLLNQIERDRQSNASGQADRERDRLRDLMERMSTDRSSVSSPAGAMGGVRPSPASRVSHTNDLNASRPPPMSPAYQSNSSSSHSNGTVPKSPFTNQQAFALNESRSVDHEVHRSSGETINGGHYNPMLYPYKTPISSPSTQAYVQQNHTQGSQQQQNQHNQYLPPGYVPPPPPPGPPPGSQGNLETPAYPYPSDPRNYAQSQMPRPSNIAVQQSQNDPWAGLNVWK